MLFTSLSCSSFPFVAFVRRNRKIPELEAGRYGLTNSDTYNFVGILNNEFAGGSIDDVNKFLNETYCGNISIEYAHIESECEREWLIEHYERLVSASNISTTTQIAVLELLLKSQAWDHFLAKKFPSVKRYGGEGAESMMAFFHQLFESAANCEVSDIVLAMPHRGRMNLLTTLLKTPPAKIFHKFKGASEFNEHVKAMGDIASHFRKWLFTLFQNIVHGHSDMLPFIEQSHRSIAKTLFNCTCFYSRRERGFRYKWQTNTFVNVAQSITFGGCESRFDGQNEK